MAVGKQQKKAGGKGKKGGKKKIIDPFLRKEWYTVRAPGMFSVRACGRTLISKTQGTKIASEEMMGRVFEVSLADLNNDEDQSFRKIKLCAEEVRGFDVLTNFHGMDMTRDKLCSLIKKWGSLVEAYTDAKTTDGYTVRLFSIGFTRRRPNQICKTSYAQAAQCRAIRLKMTTIMAEETGKGELKDLVGRLVAGQIGREIERACHGIYPLQNVFIRKVKILKKPKFDLTKLMELHADTGAQDAGNAVAREETMVETVAGAGGRL